MSIRDLLGKELLYFDGAMGTQLQAAGLEPGENTDLWNVTHGETVTAVHRAYIAAGANILKTNTFGANALKLAGTGHSVAEVVAAAFANARRAWAESPEAPADRRFTALDIGPTGKLIEPFGDLPFEEAVSLFAEQVRAGVQAGADLILIETQSDSYETKAALLAARENSDLPVFVTFTFDEDGKLLNGADVETAVLLADALGASAVGFNCGFGPDVVRRLLPRARAVTDLPLIANPNAGLPVTQDGVTTWGIAPDEFATAMADICREGAVVLGGCCGTNPDYIAALTKATRNLPVPAAGHHYRTAVTGYGSPVFFGDTPVLIGERINPTGKPLLKEALRQGDMDYVCRLGLEQLYKGAHVLDVNVGLPGLDEVASMQQALAALQGITPVPLELDTATPAVMEAGLRRYNGRPLLNSVNGKEESLATVLPLAKKYGAVVVGLCLDENGIADTAAGRLAVADKILDRAREYGLREEDVIIDPLAMTVSTSGENPSIDLEVIRTLRARGIHTVMGVSNVSFGLPNRDAINSTFLALSMDAGLAAAIMNPQSERMRETYLAFLALKGKDAGCQSYVAAFTGSPKKPAATAVTEYGLKEAVIKGLTDHSRRAAQKLLENHKAPMEIINGEIIPALNEVGEGFGNKTLFLPQLLMSADAAKGAFEVLKEYMQRAGTAREDGEPIVLATVRGDIHDIGKNIVKVLWENYGYRVLDLGRDVAPERILAAVRDSGAKLVGMTALMTTTVPAMEETIQLLRHEHVPVQILVGGAVLTADYASRIGADGYAGDAVAAVEFANALFGKA